MEKLVSQVKQFVLDEEGATAVEYGVMVALIIALCILAVKAIGVKVNTAFSNVNNALP